ncbi:hypothetical protein ABGB17_35425 [Sphaerisporangium sp. B11E5]|uniref:hypothetical protein n=1 Tax=Sphaerisporangium sp. B11E5 TaxID=3153563 RepID=UPI00325DD4EB
MGWFARHRDRWGAAPRHLVELLAGRPAVRPAEDVDLDSLLGLVAESLGYGYAFTGDGAVLELSAPRRTITVRLAGLRLEAARRPREDWPVLVAEHLSGAAGRDPDLPDVCDLAEVRPLLRTRVVRAETLEDPSRVIGRHIAADLVEILTVSGRAVRPAEAFCWPVTPGEALDLAGRNVLDDEKLTTERLDLEGVPAWRLAGSAAGAVVHLRRVEDYLLVSPDGVMVVLPHPGEMIVHPVDGLSVMRAIERMWLLARREYRSGEGGLSPHVYWWNHGRLTRIQADLVVQNGQRRLVVAPPPEFARLLADLAQDR